MKRIVLLVVLLTLASPSYAGYNDFYESKKEFTRQSDQRARDNDNNSRRWW